MYSNKEAMQILQSVNVNEQLPLNELDVQSFMERGFVVLRNAFSRDVGIDIRDNILWNELERDKAILREDRTTWPSKAGIAKVLDRKIYTSEKVFTQRLLSAIDQLLGKNQWDTDSLGLGWWVVTFPEQTSDENAEWGPSGKWHVDGAHFLHSADSPQQGLLPIFLFTDITNGDGGTAMAVGSHKVVARLLLLEENGIEGGELSSRARSIPGITDRVEELTGEIGDVALVHPFLLHAISRNLGRRGVHSVRFICNPCIRLRYPMDLRFCHIDFATPLERSIIQVRQELSVNNPPEETHIHEEELAPRKKRRKQKCQRKKNICKNPNNSLLN